MLMIWHLVQIHGRPIISIPRFNSLDPELPKIFMVVNQDTTKKVYIYCTVDNFNFLCCCVWIHFITYCSQIYMRLNSMGSSQRGIFTIWIYTLPVYKIIIFTSYLRSYVTFCRIQNPWVQEFCCQGLGTVNNSRTTYQFIFAFGICLYFDKMLLLFWMFQQNGYAHFLRLFVSWLVQMFMQDFFPWCMPWICRYLQQLWTRLWRLLRIRI